MSYEDLQQMDAHIKAKQKIYKQRPLKTKHAFKFKPKKSKPIHNRKLPPIRNKLWGAE